MKIDKQSKSEVRRLQLTGGSTYIVSLPKKWVSVHGLAAKDQVRIEWRPSGNLRVTPETTSVIRRREVELSIEEIGEEFLLDHLIGAYLSGAQIIRIRSKSGFSRAHRKIFRSFIQTTRGIEITAESDKSLDMLSLLNPSEMPLLSSINRMYLLVSSQIRDITDVLTGSDSEILDDAEEREKEIDALRLLIERQVGLILESSRLEDSMGTNRWEASEYSRIEVLSPDSPLIACIPVWHASMKLLIANLRRYKISEVHQAKLQLQGAIEELVNFENGLWDEKIGRVNALFMDRLSESLRRLCAYSTDLAEILINIHNHRNSIEVML